jgi:hypothetical protein
MAFSVGGFLAMHQNANVFFENLKQGLDGYFFHIRS